MGWIVLLGIVVLIMIIKYMPNCPMGTDVPKQSEHELKDEVDVDFIISQLIGKDRFVSQYNELLTKLSKNREFIKFIEKLRKQLQGEEFIDQRSANRKIADYFYYENANSRFDEVNQITTFVKKYGKQASAHISIYYAMYLYEK